jgi:hypothetical protein
MYKMMLWIAASLCLLVGCSPDKPDEPPTKLVAGLPDHAKTTNLINWATATRDTIKAAQWRFFADPDTPHRFLQCLFVPTTPDSMDLDENIDNSPTNIDTLKKPHDEAKSWKYLFKNVPTNQREVWGLIDVSNWSAGKLRQGYIVHHYIPYDTAMPLDSVYYRTFGEKLQIDFSVDCITIKTVVDTENTMSQWELIDLNPEIP